MAPRYKEFRDRIVGGVDALFSEAVSITPKLVDQVTGAIDDPDRAAFEIEAVLRIGGGDDDLGGKRYNWASRITVGKAELHIDHAKMPAGMTLRSGDQITALDRDGQPEFQVERRDPKIISRLVLILTAI